MKTWKQLLRQPGKTLAGIVMVALAAAVLVVCLGQMTAAKQTERHLHESFTTIALPTPGTRLSEYGFVEHSPIPEELGSWILTAAGENPHLIKTIARPGLASAYLPELEPDMFTDHAWHFHGAPVEAYDPLPIGAPYTCAVLEITLLNVPEVEESRDVSLVNGELHYGTTIVSYDIHAQAVIDRVIGLAAGMPDPTGYTLDLTVSAPDRASLESIKLEAGGRYLVYGRNYTDNDWQLRTYLRPNGHLSEEGYPLVPPFDMDKFLPLYGNAQTGMSSYIDEKGIQHDHVYTLSYEDENGMYYIMEEQEGMIHNIQMLARDCVVRLQYEWTENPDGTKTADALIPPDPEDVARYSVPIIARLEGTAEEFLASAQGEPWREVLEWIRINANAFPILGVDKLGYIVDFARENARIVQGRDFTKEELEKGEKVCILSETLAAANGISVGDTIHPRFYDYDPESPLQPYTLASGSGTVNPAAYYFTGTTPFHGQAESYTVVGLYRQNNEWACPLDNNYPFTPNTIFVPKASVESSMDYGTTGIFQTLVLQNGAIPEWNALAAQAGYDSFFTYYDQGYSVVGKRFYDYQKIVEQALLVGLATAGVLYLLFLLLFPGRLGKVLTAMGSLGATRGRKLAHILLSSLGILVPGAVCGTALGIGLWQNVTQRLLTAAGSTLNISLDDSVLVGIGAGQLLAAFLAVLLLGLVITRRKNLMRRK